MKTRYTIQTAKGTPIEITTCKSRMEYLVSQFNYVLTEEREIPGNSDFNGWYDKGVYVQLIQNTKGDWMMRGIFTLTKAQELEFTSSIIVQPSGAELINIYQSGSQLINYKSLSGAKKALMNKLKQPQK